MRNKLIIIMIITSSLLPFLLDVFLSPNKIDNYFYTILIIPAMFGVIAFPRWTIVLRNIATTKEIS
jgi:hypothetical protein